MLSNITPALEVSGGSWYNNEHLDVDFIEAVSTAMFMICARKSLPSNRDELLDFNLLPTISDIHNGLVSLGLFANETVLSKEEIEHLMMKLVYSDQIYKFEANENTPDDESRYMANRNAGDKIRRLNAKVPISDSITQQNDKGQNKSISIKQESMTSEFPKSLKQLRYLDLTSINNTSGNDKNESSESFPIFDGIKQAFSALTQTTCGNCPLSRRCMPNSTVNPENCQYLTDFLYPNIETVEEDSGIIPTRMVEEEEIKT